MYYRLSNKTLKYVKYPKSQLILDMWLKINNLVTIKNVNSKMKLSWRLKIKFIK